MARLTRCTVFAASLGPGGVADRAARCGRVAGGRGDRQALLGEHSADRTDPESVAGSVDVVDDYRMRQSTSAAAKNAGAVLRNTWPSAVRRLPYEAISAPRLVIEYRAWSSPSLHRGSRRGHNVIDHSARGDPHIGVGPRRYDKDHRNPPRATSYATGRLVRASIGLAITIQALFTPRRDAQAAPRPGRQAAPRR